MTTKAQIENAFLSGVLYVGSAEVTREVIEKVTTACAQHNQQEKR